MKIDKEKIREELERLSRQPFRDMLSLLLSANLTQEDIDAFAKKSPDRLAQSIAIMGRLSGYNEKLEIEADLSTSLTQLSDMEMQNRLKELRQPQPLPLAEITGDAKPLKAPEGDQI